MRGAARGQRVPIGAALSHWEAGRQPAAPPGSRSARVSAAAGRAEQPPCDAAVRAGRRLRAKRRPDQPPAACAASPQGPEGSGRERPSASSPTAVPPQKKLGQQGDSAPCLARQASGGLPASRRVPSQRDTRCPEGDGGLRPALLT